MDGKTQYSPKETFKIFRSKFEQIKSSISSKIGSPTFENLESKNKIKAMVYRDDIRWSNINGVTIYMFIFGSNYGYGQIRVVVY